MNGEESSVVGGEVGVGGVVVGGPTLDHSLDDDEDDMSDGSETFEDSNDLMNQAMEDEVTAQLAAAGKYTVFTCRIPCYYLSCHGAYCCC